jgi:tetratricopeptide (TPR) repeat protein
LCYLAQDNSQALGATRERLQRLGAAEWAAHLEILEIQAQGRSEEALRRIDAWTARARHTLPFLLSRAQILQQQGRQSEAQEALKRGLDGAAFLDFQRYLALDAWARLLAEQEQLPEAEALYAAGLQGQADIALASPAFFTNYAAALLALGKKDRASEMVTLALRIEPQDVVAQYLKATASATAANSTREEARYVTALIGEIDMLAKARGAQRDDWTTSPMVLAFSPWRNDTPALTRLREEAALADLLAAAVRKGGPFPVVNREVLSEVLREHKLNVSELGSGAGVLKLGQMLPASVLVRGFLRAHGMTRQLTVEAIDVQTTEQIDISQWTWRDSESPEDAVNRAAVRLLEALRDWRSPQGRVTARDSTAAEVSNGTSHGLAKGDEIWIYGADGSASASMLRRLPPVAKGVVAEVERFTAVIQLREGGENVTMGMLTALPPAPENRE